MNTKRVVILGAGPTGLGAAYRLQELGFTNFKLLEAKKIPGGLASSVTDPQGFLWDIGGHVQFSHYSYYNKILDRVLGDEYLRHERESWIRLMGRFIPYPFQYNIHRLDSAVQKKIVEELEVISRQPKLGAANNFNAWIYSTFGHKLAELFMVPYNEKVWSFPLTKLGTRWMGERVAIPDLERIKRNILRQQDDCSWGPNNTFNFPKRGGTGAIWSSVAKLISGSRIRYGFNVKSVDPVQRTVTDSTGRSVQYDILITTIPLDLLLRRTKGVPLDILELARKFLHSSVHVLGIGLRGGKPNSLNTKCWMYFPEAKSPYYRVTVFSNYSPLVVPINKGQRNLWSLMAEVSESPFKPVQKNNLKKWTLGSLREDELIRADAEIKSFWHHKVDYGYPTPFINRDEYLAIIMPWLEFRGIYSRGRFGAWKYEVSNQDHSFMQGVELINRLFLGGREVTFNDPATANSGIFLKQTS